MEKEVIELRSKTLKELREKWKELFGKEAPPYAKDRLIPYIAYRIQEIEYGGLKEKAKKELNELAEEMRKGKKISQDRKIKEGTRIMKKYRGEEHEVIAEKKGLIYRGQKYGSLSAIAEKITGTRWNGWVFFLGKQSGKAN